METVSLLYRYGLLARLLKVDVADLPVLKELSGLDPFTPLHPGPVTQADQDHPYRHTIAFVHTVRPADPATSLDRIAQLRRRRTPATPVGCAALLLCADRRMAGFSRWPARRWPVDAGR